MCLFSKYLICMQFSKINTHHNLKVYSKLKYDVWCTVVHKNWRTVLYHSLHIFLFAPHNCYTYHMPKASISIVVCCEHNLEIKAKVFELCNSYTLCHDMHRIKYFCCISQCNCSYVSV